MSTTTSAESTSILPFVCVECGAGQNSLYVEFSEGNIRLSRCERCGSVADKYIEFELVLVLIDIVLHSPAAYRHLLFNRQVFGKEIQKQNVAVRIMLVSVIAANALLKAILLHDTPHYKELLTGHSLMPALHLVLSCMLEHCGFVLATGFGLWYSPSSRHFIESYSQNKQRRMLYMSLAFPELLKCRRK